MPRGFLKHIVKTQQLYHDKSNFIDFCKKNNNNNITIVRYDSLTLYANKFNFLVRFYDSPK